MTLAILCLVTGAAMFLLSFFSNTFDSLGWLIVGFVVFIGGVAMLDNISYNKYKQRCENKGGVVVLMYRSRFCVPPNTIIPIE